MRRAGILLIFTVISFFALLSLYPVSGKDKSSGSSEGKNIKQKLASVSVPFIENKGQLNDKVAFYANTFGGTVFVTGDGEIVYSFPADEKKGWVIKETFPSAVNIEVRGKEKAKTKVNIFKGEKRLSNIPSYKTVEIGEVAEGVLLQLRAYGNNVEKLFYVEPFAEPENIVVKVEGAKGIDIDEEGRLLIKTEYGEIKFTKPIAYQEDNGRKKYVEVAYALIDEKRYTFRVGKYDKTKTLVIDPLLASTFLGGSDNEYIVDIVIDKFDNIYFVGDTLSKDLPQLIGSYDITHNGSTDIFVGKFNPDLSVLQAMTLLGGSGDDYAKDIALDNNLSIYIVGNTSSKDFPTNGDSYNQHNGAIDAFLSVLTPDLSILKKSLIIGGSNNEYISNILITNSYIYLIGITYSSDFPNPPNNINDFNVFLLEISKDFKNVNSYFYNLPNLAYITSSLYSRGKIYISIVDKDNKAHLCILRIYGYNRYSCATFSYDTVITDLEYFDTYIYIVGFTYSSSLPRTSEAFDNTHNGGADIFIGKLNFQFINIIPPNNPNNTNTNIIITIYKTTYVGGYNDDYAYDIEIDEAGNIYVTGITFSPNFPVTAWGYSTVHSGSSDIFIIKIDPNLSSIKYSTFLGGSGYDGALAMLVKNGKMYISGYTDSYDSPLNANSTNITVKGGYDAFIAILSEDKPNMDPMINFFTTNTNVNIPLTVTFTWDAFDEDGDTLTCKLDVNGDGKYEYTITDCSNNNSQQHTYHEPGTYTAVLTVYDGRGGEATESVTVTVEEPPPNNPPVVENFSVKPKEGKAPLTVTFSWKVSDKDGDKLTCKIDVNGDGKLEYEIKDCEVNTNQKHTYDKPGTYTAKLIVEDGKGGSAEATVGIKVTKENEDQKSESPSVDSEKKKSSGCSTFGNGTILVMFLLFIFFRVRIIKL